MVRWLEVEERKAESQVGETGRDLAVSWAVSWSWSVAIIIGIVNLRMWFVR